MTPNNTDKPKPGEEAQSDLPPGLSKPAQRALAATGYTRLDQLTQVSEAEVLKLHGMGPKALGLLRAALAARGLSFLAESQNSPGKDYSIHT